MQKANGPMPDRTGGISQGEANLSYWDSILAAEMPAVQARVNGEAPWLVPAPGGPPAVASVGQPESASLKRIEIGPNAGPAWGCVVLLSLKVRSLPDRSRTICVDFEDGSPVQTFSVPAGSHEMHAFALSHEFDNYRSASGGEPQPVIDTFNVATWDAAEPGRLNHSILVDHLYDAQPSTMP